MNHLFRQPGPGRSGYAALAFFAAVYLAAMALVVAPDAILDQSNAVSAKAAQTP